MLKDFLKDVMGIDSLKDILNYILLLMVGYLVNRVRAIIARRKVREHQLEYSTAIDTRISELIRELRVRLNADRAYLSQFHNGEYTVNDNPVLRKTRTHESVRDGMAYQQEIYKGMLISHVSDEMKLVMDKGHSFTRIEDLPPGKFKWLCIQGGIKAIARCAVIKHGKTIGFVGADFSSVEIPSNIELLCEYAQRVAECIE